MKAAQAKHEGKTFSTAACVVFVLLVFTGFARTFYLHALFRMPEPSVFLRIDGLVMPGWVVLLAVQVTLIRLHQGAWHRRLGTFGIVYAAAMIPIGCMATLGAARREVRAHSSFIPPQLNVLGLELMQLLLFAGLVGAGLYFRRRPEVDKRIMLLATLCILPNAIVRLVLLTENKVLTTNLALLTIWALFVLAFVAVDSLRIRRVHPAFAWGAFISVAGCMPPGREAAPGCGINSGSVCWLNPAWTPKVLRDIAPGESLISDVERVG